MKIKKIVRTSNYKYISTKEIGDNWHGRFIYTPIGFQQILNFSLIKHGKTIKLDFDNNSLLCDPEHIVQAYRGKQKIAVQTKDLDQSTDKLVGLDGRPVSFTKSEGPEEDLYSFSIPYPHWYFTAGIVSHNSIVIINNAAACLMRKLNVLHVTFELSKFKTALRYCGVFSQIPIKSRITQEHYIRSVLAKIKKTYGSDLAIYEYPPDDVSIDTIMALLDHLDKTRGWVPDVIALDYLELMLSKNHYFNRDDYKRQKKVATEVRQLAKKSGCFIITATQTNRGNQERDGGGPIDVNRVAESYGKMMPTDYVISINQTREEYEERKVRLYIAKNRNGPKSITIPAKVDYETMLITESDE